MTDTDKNAMIKADTVAKMSQCSRLQVGAVLVVRGSQVRHLGFNRPALKFECNHAGDLPCEDTVHAEVVVIAQAAREGYSTRGSTLYVTHAPCLRCAQLIVETDVARVVYRSPYRDAAGLRFLKEAGVKVVQCTDL